MNLIIHIGYPKTATTTIQNSFFRKCKRIIYLNDILGSEFFQDVFYSAEGYLEEKKDYYRKKIKSKTEDLNSNNAKVAIISSESFTSLSLVCNLQFKKGRSPRYIFNEPNVIARKLGILFSDSDLFNEVKIMVSIRNQLEFIKSYYAEEFISHYKLYSETNTFHKFISFIIKSKHHFALNILNYYQTLLTYETIFGSKNIVLLVYEDLIYQKSEYFYKLSLAVFERNRNIRRYFESVNLNKKSYKDYYLAKPVSLIDPILTFKNKYFTKLNTGLKRNKYYNKIKEQFSYQPKLKKLSYTEAEVTSLNQEFKESNMKLQKKYKVDLSKYNYPT
jgi:hypothetical protein